MTVHAFSQYRKMNSTSESDSAVDKRSEIQCDLHDL